MAKRLRLCSKQIIKDLSRDLLSFNLSPGIAIGIMGVHPANEVLRNSIGRLIGVEGIKWACRDHPSKVPKHCIKWPI